MTITTIMVGGLTVMSGGLAVSTEAGAYSMDDGKFIGMTKMFQTLALQTGGVHVSCAGCIPALSLEYVTAAPYISVETVVVGTIAASYAKMTWNGVAWCIESNVQVS